MSDNLETAIIENSQGPAKASGDAGSMEQHKLSELIAADRHVSAKKAVQSKSRGLRFNRLVPPGAA